MCYGVYISTDSSEDLAKRNSELVRFARVSDPGANPCTSFLDFPNKWYVGSESECSCTFRHVAFESVELGFCEPEDWLPEEPKEIEATNELYSILASILSSGSKVDIMDLWEGQDGTLPGNIKVVDVSLGSVPAKAFRLFESHKFRFTK